MKLFVPATLWYNDEAGNFVGVPDYTKPYDPFCGIENREAIVYQVSRFPCQLIETHLRINPDGSSSRVCEMTSSYWEELVIAMATALPPLRRFRLSEAILIAATACERCMNALAWQYGVKDGEGHIAGYPEDSEEYRDTNTQCHFCDEEMAAKAAREPK